MSSNKIKSKVKILVKADNYLQNLNHKPDRLRSSC